MSIKLGKYFEDFSLGELFKSPSRTITEADIVNFAGVSGDFTSIHTDEEFSKRASIFKGRVAHGLLTLSISIGLLVRLGIFEGTVIALLEISKLRFTRPVKIHDTINVEAQVIEKRETSKLDRGIVSFKEVVRNQLNEVVVEGEFNIMIKRCTPRES